MYRFFLLIILIHFIGSAHSQIQVDASQNIIDLVKSLEGPGVKISNISWHIRAGVPSSPIGYFNDPTGFTGLNEGLLITSGSAKMAEGPNDFPSEGQDNSDFTYDNDLQQFSGGLTLYDLCYVQFDVVTSSNSLSFDYVFASEEYPEYLEYNDVFALMISGPGIIGTKNLAVVPNTNIPVSVSNINHLTNSQYYKGVNSLSPYTQYDGMTVVLTAFTNVMPCQTYRIKLAIADATDHIFDSGVFIKKGSFKSEAPPSISVQYQHPDFNYGIEDCNHAVVTFTRPAGTSDTTKLSYKIQLTGSAVNGVDYEAVADSIIIPKGENDASFIINPIADQINEGEEIVRIVVLNSCPQFPSIASFDVPIRDKFPYTVPSESICFEESTTLNNNPQSGTSIIWETNGELSCTNCLSPVATPDTTKFYSYTITHTATGCEAEDSVKVQITKIVPDFSYYQDECYTSSDITFINNSSEGTNYFWDFGDGKTSDEANPIHEFPFNTTRNSVSYLVKLTVRSTSPACSEDISKTITISDPLFIPNLITADENGKNDVFKVSGVGGQCWTLYLYNRWGGLVYKKENYTNEFRGSEVEPGNYYYLIENAIKDRSFSGWLHIVGNVNQ